MDIKMIHETIDDLWSSIYDFMPFIRYLDEKLVGEIESELDVLEFQYRPFVCSMDEYENRKHTCYSAETIANIFWNVLKDILNMCDGKLTEQQDEIVENELAFLYCACDKNGIELGRTEGGFMDEQQLLMIAKSLRKISSRIEKAIENGDNEKLRDVKKELRKTGSLYRPSEICMPSDAETYNNIPFE